VDNGRPKAGRSKVEWFLLAWKERQRRQRLGRGWIVVHALLALFFVISLIEGSYLGAVGCGLVLLMEALELVQELREPRRQRPEMGAESMGMTEEDGRPGRGEE